MKTKWVWRHKENEKVFKLLEEEIESIGFSNKARGTVHDKTRLDIDQSFVQDFKRFFGPIRIEEKDVDFILQKYKSDLRTSEISPCKSEVADKISIKDSLIKTIFSIHIITI